MLEEFLHEWRRVQVTLAHRPYINFFTYPLWVVGRWLRSLRLRSQIVDTVLTKLFARSEKTMDLDGLLEELEPVILPEVEPVLRATGLYSALCKVYSKRGHDVELLEGWSKAKVRGLPSTCILVFFPLLTFRIIDLSRASG